ncbi:MAG: hypothetical protein ACRD1Y_00815 [Terriglobales bacterium]
MLRLALPPSLRAGMQPLAGPGGFPALTLLSPALPADERQRQRWLRLWMERRKASGASAAEAEAALQIASVRAVLALLDRQADAALLDETEPGAEQAWQLLEPRSGQACAEVWIGEPSPGSAAAFAWWLPPAAASVAAAAAQLQSAAADFARWAQQPVKPAIVSFLGGRDSQAAATARLASTLAARAPATVFSLYSPLLFRDGALQLSSLLAQVREHTGPGLPLLCIPPLPRSELASALLAQGGALTGPLLAGAEAAVARVRADVAPARLQATCAWLLRRAACE